MSLVKVFLGDLEIQGNFKTNEGEIYIENNTNQFGLNIKVCGNLGNSHPPTNFLRSRGTKTAPQAVQVGDLLYGIYCYPYDGANWLYAGGLYHWVEGITGGIVETAFSIENSISPGGSREVFRIDKNGALMPLPGVISTPAAELKLEQTGDVNGPCQIYLRNRTGICGALLKAPDDAVVDIQFSGNTMKANWRFEMRETYTGVGGATKSFQFANEGMNPIWAIISERGMAVLNSTAPSSSPADRFQMYSADIAAGNAAPHFLTENGNLIKLYQQAHIVDADGTLADVTTKFNTLLARLENLGLLATV